MPGGRQKQKKLLKKNRTEDLVERYTERQTKTEKEKTYND